MRKTVIHIGLPKTATTALQKYVFQVLPAEKFCYLGTRQPRSSNDSKAYMNVMAALEANTAQATELIDIAKADLSHIGAEKVVVLSEEMIAVDTNTQWQEKIARLATVLQGSDSKIIVTVRNPLHAVFSLYVEIFRSVERQSPTFAQFLLSNQAKIYDYYYLISVIRESFSERQICVVPFENLKSGRDFLSEIERIVECPPSVNQLPLENNNKVYKGDKVSIVPLSVQAALDRIVVGTSNEWKRNMVRCIRCGTKPIRPLLRHIPLTWTQQLLQPPDANLIAQRYANSNEWLLREYGIPYQG